MKFTTFDIVYIALFAVLITICTWIAIPAAVPFTLQTFAVFIAVGLLGTKRGVAAILVYILLGVIGLPVFSGFSSGLGWLLGNTGGYIIGFIFTALAMGLIIKFFGKKTIVLVISMVVGLAICYIFGTLWFMFIYTQNVGPVGLATVISWCVLPYIIPDTIKIIIAVIIIKRVSKHIKLS